MKLFTHKLYHFDGVRIITPAFQNKNVQYAITDSYEKDSVTLKSKSGLAWKVKDFFQRMRANKDHLPYLKTFFWSADIVKTRVRAHAHERVSGACTRVSLAHDIK